MTWIRSFATVATVTALGLAPQAPVTQSRLLGYQVTFQITQNARETGPSSNDQITVIFASRSVEGPRPPRPFFGDDIIQEFSFSGVDFIGNQLRFTRRVNDRSFLDARYIRVVNYGGDGWAGDQISVTVDGQDILRNVRMYPRIGGDPSKGFQKFNPREWSGRSYWEADLSRFRRYSAK